MKPRTLLAALSVVTAAAFFSGCMSQPERAALLNGPYTLEVDYSQSVETLVKAGRYNWIYYQVTSANFPSSENGQGTISVALVPYSPGVSLDYLLDGPAAGMRPATLKELLAFGQAYPDVQRKVPVIALGSSANLEVPTYHEERDDVEGLLPIIIVTRKVKELYPVLEGGLLGRIMNLEWFDDQGNYGAYYALFVKKR
jgi:hypothetical protein